MWAVLHGALNGYLTCERPLCVMIKICRFRTDHCCRCVLQPLEVVILFPVKSVWFNDGVRHKVNMLPLLVKVVSIRSIIGRVKRLLPVHAVAAGFEL